MTSMNERGREAPVRMLGWVDESPFLSSSFAEEVK